MMRWVLVAVITAMVTTPAASQFRRGRRAEYRSWANYKQDNAPREIGFTFVRVRYVEGAMGGCYAAGVPGWAHDYPTSEHHFGKILTEITNVEVNPTGTSILMLDDPELSRYPVAYLSEPGCWSMSPAEQQGLRNYLLKGGFLIVDDFVDDQWYNFEQQVHNVFPELRLMRLDTTHPIFNSFFAITKEEMAHYEHPYWRRYRPEFWGLFEDNDPAKRLLMIVNYNNDIGDYWEWSDSGWIPIDLSNDAYKLGVNYLVYAMMR
jgi:Domain of unknown function (DUF4159)